MGLFSSIIKLFRKDSQVDKCCADGVCTCSSDENNLVFDSTSFSATSSMDVSTSTSSLTLSDGAATTPSPVFSNVTTGASSTTVELESAPCCEESIVKESFSKPVVSAEKSPVTATADEINMALETAAEADKLAEENYIPTPPLDDLSKKKKKSNTKKASSKLNRKSTTRRKKS